MKTDIFSWDRFLQLIKHSLVSAWYGEEFSRWRFLLIAVGAVYVLSLFYPFMLMLFLATCWFLVIYTSSRCFADYRTKAGRCQAIMLPCSNVEKFAARVIVNAVLPSVALIVLTLVSTVVILVFHYPEAGEQSFELLRNLISLPERYPDMPIVGAALLALSMFGVKITLFVFGGSFFGRFAIVKIWLSMQVLMWVFGMAFSHIVLAVGQHLNYNADMILNFMQSHIVPIVWLALVAVLAAIAALLYSSYRVFKSRNIASRLY